MKKQQSSKKQIAVLFGGPSAEHEISILTALQAISAMDSITFDIHPFYLHPSGKFYTGTALLDTSFYRNFSTHLAQNAVQEVVLLADPESKGFVKKQGNKIDCASLYPIDVYFMCFHGQYGEDGCVQGLLELKQAAYTGCNLTAAAVAMNKHLSKSLVKECGIPVLTHALITKIQAQRSFRDVYETIISTKGLEHFPLFIKPCHLGSSIGISIARDKASLQAGLAKALYYDDQVLIEPCITHLMEINSAVMDADPPEVSILEMPIATSDLLSFEDKYLRGGSKSKGTSSATNSGMAALARVIDPDIDPEIKATLISYAQKAYRALGCSGTVRIDFMIDLDSGSIYFNELNPIPGSLAFYLWEKSTPRRTFTEVLNKMIEEALLRHKNRLSLQQTLDFRALK